MEFLLSALILGLMGSFHCAGMCGPIALSLPVQANNFFRKIAGIVLYNLGRVLTYALMGLLLGLIGQRLKLIGFQQWVSVVIGSVMVLSVFIPSVFKNFKIPRLHFYVNGVRNALQRAFKTQSTIGLLLIGSLNGLLPCGLVYIALASSIVTSDAFSGALFMFVFGLSTLPMMVFIAIIGNLISSNIRNKVQKAIPLAVVIVGLLFVLRGLCLGIPYLSPYKQKMQIVTPVHNSNTNCEHSCCHETPMIVPKAQNTNEDKGVPSDKN
jgi:sulfite exporter TauE/SafE